MEIKMGSESLILDYKQYPVTFAALTSIKGYNETCWKAEEDYTKTMYDAKLKLQKAKEAALSKLKEGLT